MITLAKQHRPPGRYVSSPSGGNRQPSPQTSSATVSASRRAQASSCTARSSLSAAPTVRSHGLMWAALTYLKVPGTSSPPASPRREHVQLDSGRKREGERHLVPSPSGETRRLNKLTGVRRYYHRGRLVKDSKSGKPKMSCRNWECGVVVPVSVTAAAAAYDDDARFFSSSGGAATPTTIKRVPTPTPLLTPTPADGGLDAIFSSTLPVPMVVPGRPYGPNEEPWFYTSAR